MDDEIHPTDTPALHTAYLDDMRGWLGDEALAALLASAPDALVALVAAVRTAWTDGKLAAVREAGHRLKGGAGSVACLRLSELGQSIQLLAGLDDRAPLDALDGAEGDALAALTDYRARLAANDYAQDTPVPPRPQ